MWTFLGLILLALASMGLGAFLVCLCIAKHIVDHSELYLIEELKELKREVEEQ